MKPIVSLLFFIGITLSACTEGSRNMSSSREAKILNLRELMISQRDDLRNHGVDDGNGLLFQSTEAYLKLKMICTEDEIKLIDAELQPWRREK